MIGPSSLIHTMRLFLVLLIAILFSVQAFGETSSMQNTATSLSSMMSQGNDMELYKKHHHPRKINCSYACSRRCRRASRKNVCLRACKTCCARCHCVPPGTYGNKSACPCYARLKTHGHKPKCP